MLDAAAARLSLVGMLLALPAGATPITDPADLSAGFQLLDFEDQTPGTKSSPLVIEGVTFSSDEGLSIVSLEAFGANGTEVEGLTLQPNEGPAIAPPYVTLTLDFAAPLKEVLLGWWDPNFPGNFLQAFDASGTLLEQASPALSAPGGGGAAWLGFVRPSAEIAQLRVVPASTSDFYTIDNLHLVVPEPSTALLLGLALAALGARRRRGAPLTRTG
ncbi:MAG: PEP-CTERM sorting domain-containing protein [Myxococcota bacterium]|nr:PEP-CTERM sorting domain-containing protein [Myxococcota bacterium]